MYGVGKVLVTLDPTRPSFMFYKNAKKKIFR